MAIYRRSYEPYPGPLTSQRFRFLILPRFVFQDLFQSRFLTAFVAASLVVPVTAAVMIYLAHNLNALTLLQIPVEKMIPIDATFFLWVLRIQAWFSLFLAILAGPGLVSMDLANHALPLYLSRPFTRRDYLLGKISVLVILLSAITWIPDLFLFLLQTSLAGPGWLGDHLRIAWALFAGAFVQILVLSLITLAVSAWVRWKPVAAAVILGSIFVAAGSGEAFNQLLHSTRGKLLDLVLLISSLWSWLFGVENWTGVAPVSAMLVLALACGVCLALLACRLRACEVIE